MGFLIQNSGYLDICVIKSTCFGLNDNLVIKSTLVPKNNFADQCRLFMSISTTNDSSIESLPVKLNRIDRFSMENNSQELSFEEILKSHRAAISRVVTSYEAIKSLQEELYQEISMAIWKALPKFDNQSSLKTYILSIAHRRAISHVAKYAREPRQIQLDEQNIKTEQCPSEQFEKQQRINKMLLAMRKLPMVERQLVALALEGVSYKEIALILGITTNLVGVKLGRAKHKLKLFMT